MSDATNRAVQAAYEHGIEDAIAHRQDPSKPSSPHWPLYVDSSVIVQKAYWLGQTDGKKPEDG